MACGNDNNCRCEVCRGIQNRTVRLAYGPNCTLVLADAIGQSSVDMTPIVRCVQNNAKLEFLPDLCVLRLTNGDEDCFYDICISDLAKHCIDLNDLRDVVADNPQDGDVIIYDQSSNTYITFNLTNAITNIGNRVTNLENSLTNLTNTVNNFITDVNNRLSRIENLIYNFPNDLTTKIPRGNINLFSGGMGSSQWIRSRDGVQNGDLNQS